jgi:hypothetical protein
VSSLPARATSTLLRCVRSYAVTLASPCASLCATFLRTRAPVGFVLCVFLFSITIADFADFRAHDTRCSAANHSSSHRAGTPGFAHSIAEKKNPNIFALTAG